LSPLFQNCEPTYEELKPLWFELRDLDVMVDCEPTYEELKPVIVVDRWYYRWYCEPTYEELKLRAVQRSVSMSKIASLPMRN